MAVYEQALISPGASYLQSGVYSAQDDRRPMFDFAGMGIPDLFTNYASGFKVTTDTLLNVAVAAGIAYVPGGNTFDQGSYRVKSDSSRILVLDAANPTLPRIDLIVLRVLDDDADASGFTEARLEAVPGTATAGATLVNRTGAVALTALAESSKSVILLADVLVQAGATFLSASDIADRRTPLHNTGRDPTQVFPSSGSNPFLDDIEAALKIAPTVTNPVLNNSGTRVRMSLSQAPWSLNIFWELLWVNSGGVLWAVMSDIPLSAEVATSQTTTSATYVDLTTAGPSMTIPRAGVYDISFGAQLQTSAAGTQCIVSPKIGAAATADADGAENRSGQIGAVTRTVRKTCAKGDVIKLQYKSNGTATLTAANRWLSIRPIYLT